MESNPNTPTIAELWREFDGLIRLYIPHLTKLVSPEYSVDDVRRPEYERQRNQCNERLAELRAKLLVRCKPWVGWHDDGSIYVEPRMMPNNATPDQLRRVAAIYEFAAWELEQRQKEQAAT